MRNIKEPLINYAIPLAYRLIHNQGGTLKACPGLVKSDNAECEPACKPRRARPEAHIYGIVLLAKDPAIRYEARFVACTLQVSQRHGIINQRFLSILGRRIMCPRSLCSFWKCPGYGTTDE